MLSTEHSKGGDVWSGAALRSGERRRRLKCRGEEESVECMQEGQSKEGAENREHVTRSSSRKLQRVNVKTLLINSRYGEFQLISPDCI